MDHLLPWTEDRWDDIIEVLEEFQSYLSDRVPRFAIERNVDVLDWRHHAGVYLLFDANQELVYVGLTLDRFDRRTKHHENRFEYAHWDLVVFPGEFDFLAPALEGLLNRRLKRRLSGHGKHI